MNCNMWGDIKMWISEIKNNIALMDKREEFEIHCCEVPSLNDNQ